jgi:3',5'-cyclic AMP phosphodiesterase CpdA
MSGTINRETAASVRLVHLSDIHVTVRPLGWQWADWFSKRLAAWINLRLLGRGFRFRRADLVLGALAAELRRRRPDHVVFSGDATALGFEAELARAAALLGVNDPESLPGLAVPGNHDYCTYRAEASGQFERHFAPWLAGERIDGQTYPFAQRVGPVWLAGVNTSAANRWPWDASGSVGAAQLERLERLLARLEGGPRILVTHYPVCVASGKRERRSHGLRDLTDLIAVAGRGGINLWLHGHRHGWYYHVQSRWASFPVICAGSATQNGLWSYGEYTITGRRLQAVRRVFDVQKECFRERDSFELHLKG